MLESYCVSACVRTVAWSFYILGVEPISVPIDYPKQLLSRKTAAAVSAIPSTVRLFRTVDFSEEVGVVFLSGFIEAGVDKGLSQEIHFSVLRLCPFDQLQDGLLDILDVSALVTIASLLPPEVAVDVMIVNDFL